MRAGGLGLSKRLEPGFKQSLPSFRIFLLEPLFHRALIYDHYRFRYATTHPAMNQAASATAAAADREFRTAAVTDIRDGPVSVSNESLHFTAGVVQRIPQSTRRLSFAATISARFRAIVMDDRGNEHAERLDANLKPGLAERPVAGGGELKAYGASSILFALPLACVVTVTTLPLMA
jgi:hypothetical protein